MLLHLKLENILQQRQKLFHFKDKNFTIFNSMIIIHSHQRFKRVNVGHGLTATATERPFSRFQNNVL